MLKLQIGRICKMRITPIAVSLVYVGIIIFCAVLYYLIPGELACDKKPWDSLYFSIVTITTLGYGDLTPLTDTGKAIAALEALAGIVLLGLFFLATSLYVAEKEQRKK